MDIERCRKHALIRFRVIGLADRADLDQADPAEAGKNARRDPFSGRVDPLCIGGNGDIGTGSNNPVTPDQHGAALNRRTAVTNDDLAAGNRSGLRSQRSSDQGRSGGEKQGQALHFTSPSPG